MQAEHGERVKLVDARLQKGQEELDVLKKAAILEKERATSAGNKLKAKRMALHQRQRQFQTIKRQFNEEQNEALATVAALEKSAREARQHAEALKKQVQAEHAERVKLVDARLQKGQEEVVVLKKAAILEKERATDSHGKLVNISAKDIDFDEPRVSLGRGTFSNVFRSSERGWNGTAVAVKVCKLTKGKHRVTKMMQGMFDEEARLLAQLLHDNIVCFRGITTIDGCPSLVTEYVGGGSLYNALYSPPLGNTTASLQGPSNKAKVLEVATDVAAAMSYLHSQVPPIIHHDLKPQNVLLEFHNKSIRAKVADYGLSTFKVPDVKRMKRPPGTIPYMAPELLRLEPYDGHVDIYAFGIMLNEMVSGGDGTKEYVPWRDEYMASKKDFMATVQREVEQGVRPRINSSVSEEQAAIITHCWSQRPSDRPSFKSIIGMLQAQAAAVSKVAVAEATESGLE